MARPRKFDETRVLDAAMDVFWRHGYEGTSTRDLTERTGVGPSSLYGAFGDKRALYLRALRTYYESATREQVALLERPGPARDRVRELMTHAIDMDLAGEGGRTGCFAINAAVEMAGSAPEVRAEVDRQFSTVEAALRETIARGQRAGEFTADGDPATLARQILSTYYGLRVLARVRSDRQALLDVVESALAAL
ncbi:TetR/AcrR family transcriptional regulator [Actinomycetota bacterium Odt1-20B]